MANFRLLHPDTEMKGQMMIDFEQAAGSEEFLPILKRHNLDNLNPDEWYSAQRWLDVLQDIASAGFMNLVSIGMQQVENAEWPDEFYEMSIADVLRETNGIYQGLYRGTDIGEIAVEVINDTHLKVILRIFEPDDLWYGNIYQIVKKFNSTDLAFSIAYDEDALRRDEGGEKTIIHVKFKTRDKRK